MRDTETQKAFITRTHERVRLSYDRRVSELPRQCVFVGTTNEGEFLRAPDNRRFWPIHVTVPFIDTDKLEQNRDQIWTEALREYRGMIAEFGDAKKIHFRLSPTARAEAKTYQESARVQSTDDVDHPTIIEFLNNPVNLQRYLSHDGYEDLEAADALVLRATALPYQIIQEALGEELPRNENARRGRSQTIGYLMNRIEGWTSYARWCAANGVTSDKITIPGYKRGRGYVRIDATVKEIRQGYRIIEDPDTENLL